MIATRRVIDRRRREEVRGAVEEFGEEIPADFVGFDEVELRDESDRAQRALEHIRPEEQRILRMSFSRPRPTPRSRPAPMCPSGTVKSHARRGLERVRKLLSSGEND